MTPEQLTCLHLHIHKLENTEFSTLMKEGSQPYKCDQCGRLLVVKEYVPGVKS